ncbi:MAG: hypothetical protein AB9915_01600 [Candidatus Dojkabacteria bacterium]
MVFYKNLRKTEEKMKGQIYLYKKPHWLQRLFGEPNFQVWRGSFYLDDQREINIIDEQKLARMLQLYGEKPITLQILGHNEDFTVETSFQIWDFKIIRESQTCYHSRLERAVPKFKEILWNLLRDTGNIQ